MSRAARHFLSGHFGGSLSAQDRGRVLGLARRYHEEPGGVLADVRAQLQRDSRSTRWGETNWFGSSVPDAHGQMYSQRCGMLITWQEGSSRYVVQRYSRRADRWRKIGVRGSHSAAADLAREHYLSDGQEVQLIADV